VLSIVSAGTGDGPSVESTGAVGAMLSAGRAPGLGKRKSKADDKVRHCDPGCPGVTGYAVVCCVYCAVVVVCCPLP
jgi:hypothetical protein